MKILMAPFTSNNPYQSNLIAAMEKQGASVDTRTPDKHLPLMLKTYDVIHLHWLHPYYRGAYALTRLARLAGFVAALLTARLTGCSLVWTVHNIRTHDPDYPLLDTLIRRFVMRIATGFIVHCEWAKQELMNTYPSIALSQVIVTPHGNYMNDYANPPQRAAARNKLSIPENHVTFLFFGFIRPYKGINELIAAFKALSSAHQLSLIIAGKPATPELEQSILKQCEDFENAQLILDYVDSNRVPSLFAAADFYVLPYHNIVTSGAAILGMTMAKALIAPRLGCIPETLDSKGAVLFDPALPYALRDAMETALTVAMDSTSMGKHNRIRVEAWSWDTIARKTLAFFYAQQR